MSFFYQGPNRGLCAQRTGASVTVSLSSVSLLWLAWVDRFAGNPVRELHLTQIGCVWISVCQWGGLSVFGQTCAHVVYLLCSGPPVCLSAYLLSACASSCTRTIFVTDFTSLFCQLRREEAQAPLCMYFPCTSGVPGACRSF